MKKMKLWQKLVGTTAVIGGLFLGGVLIVQNLSEQTILAASNDRKSKVAQERVPIKKFDEMSIEEYYSDYLNYDTRIITEFEKKYQVDATKVKLSEVDREADQYLTALTFFYENGSQPILARNEQKKDRNVVVNEDGGAMYSLETLSSDIAALSDEIDATTAIIDICQKYTVDPDGKINDLSLEAIIEINEKLFELSDHPK